MSPKAHSLILSGIELSPDAACSSLLVSVLHASAVYWGRIKGSPQQIKMGAGSGELVGTFLGVSDDQDRTRTRRRRRHPSSQPTPSGSCPYTDGSLQHMHATSPLLPGCNLRLHGLREIESGREGREKNRGNLVTNLVTKINLKSFYAECSQSIKRLPFEHRHLTDRTATFSLGLLYESKE